MLLQEPFQEMPEELPRETSSSSQAPSLSDDGYESAVSQPMVSPEDADPRGFRGGHARRPNDAFIAVMGITGSGKSSFISKCSDKFVTIGHKQDSCTSVVDVYPYEVSPESTVYLIDTPGFDDTSKSDSDVLEEIAMWLSDSYKNDILLDGIIYLHRISDVRMQGSARRNLVTFRELCGEDALKRVILASTMWDTTREEVAVMREQELKETDHFWGWMLSQGSSCHRYNNTAESARQIVLSLTGRGPQFVTDLQTQMVDKGLSLDETTAGRNLNTALQKEIKRLTQSQRALEEKIKTAEKAHDRMTQEAFKEERDRNRIMLEKAQNGTKALNATMETMMAKRDQRLAEMKKEIRDLQEREKASSRLVKEQALALERERSAKHQEKQPQQESTDPPSNFNSPWQRSTNLVTAGQNHRKGEVKNPSTKIWFSISLNRSLYFLRSPEQWSCNASRPLERVGSDWKRIEFGCMAAEQPGEWIARYGNDTWVVSKNFAQHYPHLVEKIKFFEIGNLDICALGPNQQYYARWLDGSWSCKGSSKLARTIQNLIKERNKIVAISLGFGESFLVSYERNTGYLHCSHDLRGYYRGLDRFLKSHTNISIHAVTLDPQSQTDYLVVFTEDGTKRRDRPKNKLHCSNRETRHAISDWWETSKEIREAS
ncbi:uncharacterized protein FTOL_09442 [Fusarium torulosum]|uniref:G domain-containing protein n=1 Tax=Fusarium torulosum TaxID=33205 RepID=A0AAE8MG62_9HYPO|nr:uncharacterized protein FTOL_09442 [Fusarium torulosum]